MPALYFTTPYTIAATDSVESTDSVGVTLDFAGSGRPVLTNLGTLRVSTTYSGSTLSATGVNAINVGIPNRVMTNEAGALLEVTFNGAGDAYGIQGGAFLNWGVVHVTSSGGAAVGSTAAGERTIRNAGVMTVEGVSAVGLQLSGSGGATVNDGSLSVVGHGGITIGIEAYSVANYSNLVVRNDSGPNRAIGVAAIWNVENQGLIDADLAIRMTAPLTQTNRQIRNNVTGQIFGDVLVTGTAVRFDNIGRVQGNISLGDGADQFFGGNGHFDGVLNAGGGDDVIYGGAGDAILEGGDGNDLIYGDSGVDTASYSHASSGVVVTLAITTAQNTGGAGFDILYEIENLIGSAFNDTFFGNLGDNVFNGGGGVDTVSYANYALPLNVSLAIGGPQNTIYAGTDTLISIENLTGSGAGDTLSGNAQDNTLDGGGGVDTVSYEAAGAGVTVNLAVRTPQSTGGDGTDTLLNFENLAGSAYADVLIGDGGANALSGGLGSDIMYGVAGDDVLRDGGETSNRDFLYGGSGSDTYYVTSAYAAPNEDLVYEGGTNPDLMAGVWDVDTIHSGGDFFWDFYSVGEVLYIDAATGSLLVGGKDVLNKTIYGGAGNDRVVTYGHNSVVDLGAGTDAVDFGPYGLDSSYAGQNTLVMRPGTGIDYIYNFRSGVDKVDLTAFHFGITGAQVLAQAVNVDNPGTANDYSYFYLTNAGGVNNFVVFMGLLGSQLQAGDFLT